MDFERAIAAHAEWKNKLSRYLQNPDKSLSPAEIALDNRCELGKWIEAEGKQFSSLAELAAVKSTHAQFHKIAASIVQRANSGEKVSEEVALGAKSEFVSASTAVVRSVMALSLKSEVEVNFIVNT